jgi:hypothetical protein
MIPNSSSALGLHKEKSSEKEWLWSAGFWYIFEFVYFGTSGSVLLPILSSHFDNGSQARLDVTALKFASEHNNAICQD